MLRTAWLYGIHGEDFVKAIMERVKQGRPLDVVPNQVRGPTSPRDLAGAIIGVIRALARGLLDVANAGACSRFEMADAIVHRRVEVRPMTTAEAARQALRPANSSLTTVRWTPTGLPLLRTWQAALDDFLDGYSG